MRLRNVRSPEECDTVKRVASQRQYTLFGTSACHLCELAEEMLEAQCRINPGLAFEKVDISASDALLELYGVRIPVLRAADGRELGWPFTAPQLQDFIGL
jgi:hypothetical protein